MTGQSVYIAAPAYAPEHSTEALRMIHNVRQWAEQFDWQVTVSPLMHQPLGRGAWHCEQKRLDDLSQAMAYDWAIAFRGGYGSLQLVPALAALPMDHAPRWFGFSDLTVLHGLWWQRNQPGGVYGPLRAPGAGSRYDLSLRACIEQQSWRRNAQTDPMVRPVRSGTVRGRLFAGCLSVLAATVGTAAAADLSGAVLAIEDVDEKPYQFDLAMQQLYQAGCLNGVAGLIGGPFSHQSPAHYLGPTIDELLALWAARLGVPAIGRLPFGHIEDPLCLPMGRPVALQVDDAQWQLAMD